MKIILNATTWQVTPETLAEAAELREKFGPGPYIFGNTDKVARLAIATKRSA